MATKQHSDSKKTRNSISPGKGTPWAASVTNKLRSNVSSSKRSDWAACMNGADPEWLQTRQAIGIAQVFDGHFPSWYVESEPWRPVTGERFKFHRTNYLGLTADQCAAYLRVHRSTIGRWENGSDEVPYAAFEALRLLSHTAAQRLSHKHWDGWFINRKSGELVSPNIGRLAVKPEEINGLPALYNRLSIFQSYVEKLEGQVDALEAENAALRSNDKTRKIAAELENMQGRIAELLAGVRTAEIIEFNPPAVERRLATR